MKVFGINASGYITAGDNTLLKELFNPEKDRIDVSYSLACAELSPGASSLPHKLSSSEVYYILDGEGKMHIGEDEEVLRTGCAVYIPPGSVQYIENTGPAQLRFLCIVSPPWKKEDEAVL